MSVDPNQVRIGMEVYGTDGELVGTVKTVSQTDFILNRPWARDLVVPIEAIQAVIDDMARPTAHSHVVLTIRARSVDGQAWPHPD
ncbi:MAG: DUF2171 domain-containing protein [Chloroflexi bacterium]|nr:DUF2171 domain-containing protein [Chloroflexota bacterium]